MSQSRVSQLAMEAVVGVFVLLVLVALEVEFTLQFVDLPTHLDQARGQRFGRVLRAYDGCKERQERREQRGSSVDTGCHG